MGPGLTELREQIAEVDRALLELLRRRLALAAEIGRHKAAVGAAVVVRDVEDRVLTRARQHAEACGVSEEVMEAIYTAIVRGSVERQHRVGVELRAARGQRVLVVGGAGAMGGWFRRFLGAVGHRCDVVDPAVAGLPGADGSFADLEELTTLDDYAAVVVSVPLASTPEVLERVVSRRPPGLVVEVASIKAHLAEPLARAEEAGVQVCALHPMFGPGKAIYEPLTFVLAWRDDPAREQARIEGLLRHPYTHLVAIPFTHHDRLMGWLLGLAHLTAMLFGSALARSGLAPEQLHECASTTFARQAATARSVLAEDPDLYLDIQRLNPHRDDVYRATREALARLVALVEAGDREGFRETLTAAHRTLEAEP
jgi:chorismate mutase/prephenate dehydrogenase